MCSIKQTKNARFQKYFMHKDLHMPSHFIIIYLYILRLAWHFHLISFLWSNKHFWLLKINCLESKFDCYCIETIISVVQDSIIRMLSLCASKSTTHVYTRHIWCMSISHCFHSTFWFDFFPSFFIKFKN